MNETKGLMIIILLITTHELILKKIIKKAFRIIEKKRGEKENE